MCISSIQPYYTDTESKVKYQKCKANITINFNDLRLQQHPYKDGCLDVA